MPRSKWKKIATGIYRDGTRLRAIVNAASGRIEKSFALDADLGAIKLWRNTEKVRLDTRARRKPLPGKAGTITADARRYVSQVKHLASWKSRRSELDAWIAALGPKMNRARITEEQVRKAVSDWQHAGVAVRTCEHRVATLRHMFKTLDGSDVLTPCDRVKFQLPETQPVYVPAALIQKVARTLPFKDTRARLMVLATTGVRPSELMRTLPDDVNLKERIWIIRTAKGGTRPAMRLNDNMVAAWEAFIAAKAWGRYDTSTHAKRLYEAGWPEGVRPYNARASFGMELSRQGADLADIQQILGHRNIKTTRAYYVPREDSRIAAALESVGKRFRWAPKKKR